MKGRFVVAAWVACVGTGCVPTRVLLPDCQGDVGVVETDWVPMWQGYGVRWRDLSHRLAYVRAGVELPRPDGTVGAELGILGGDWSTGKWWRDFPELDVGYAWYQAPEASVYFGEVPLRVRMRDNPSGYAEQEVVLYTDDLDLDAHDHWAVALRGICVDTSLPLEATQQEMRDLELTYDPRLGYTVAGLGSGVTSPEFTPGTNRVSFRVWSHYEAALLAEDVRADLRAAVPFAQIATNVRYMLIGYDDGDVVPLTPISKETDIVSEREVYTDIEAERHALDGDVSPGMGAALPLLRSWNLDLNTHDPEASRGRFLRAWAARIDQFAYDPSDGAVQGEVVGYASHASLIQEGDMQYIFQSEVDVLELADGQVDAALVETFEDLETLGNWERALTPR